MIDLASSVSALLVLSVISITLNTLCIHMIRTRPAFRQKPSTVFIGNLLTTHLIQGIFVLPMYVGKSFKPKDLFWSRFFKNGFLFSYLLAFYGVCLGVLIISFDRFLATYLLNKYKTTVTFKNAITTVIISWTYTLILCLIPFIPQTKTVKLKVDNNAYKNSSMPSITNFSIFTTTPLPKQKPRTYFYTPQDEWTVFMLFFNAALPFLIIVVSYTYIIIKIKAIEATQHKYQQKNNRNQLEMEGKSGKKHREQEKVKGFKKYKEITYLTLVLSVIYFLLWTPSIIYYTVLSVCDHKCFPPDWNDSKPEKHIVYIIKFLSYMNALVSPVIYCLRHPEMRKWYKEFVRVSILRKPKTREMGNDNLGNTSTTF